MKTSPEHEYTTKNIVRLLKTSLSNFGVMGRGNFDNEVISRKHISYAIKNLYTEWRPLG